MVPEAGLSVVDLTSVGVAFSLLLAGGAIVVVDCTVSGDIVVMVDWLML